MITMMFACDQTDEYFTDDWDDKNEIVSYYIFSTPEKFLETWRKVSKNPDSMWYWVLDDKKVICSGACDPYDEEIFIDYWKL